MNTPTPRTDAFAIIASPSRNQYLDFAEQLERELTAVTDQRGRLAEALRKIKNAGGGYADPYDELDFIDGVTFEALQSLDPDHFPDVGNMIGTTTTKP